MAKRKDPRYKHPIYKEHIEVRLVKLPQVETRLGKSHYYDKIIEKYQVPYDFDTEDWDYTKKILEKSDVIEFEEAPKDTMLVGLNNQKVQFEQKLAEIQSMIDQLNNE